MTDTATKNRREYSRVDVYIPLGCRLLDKEEHGLVKARLSAEVMLADFKLLPAASNNPQLESVQLLNQKLDMIIKMVGLQYEGFHALPFKFVSLSGKGLKFSSSERYSPGDILECKMMLNLNQSTAIYAYGEVLRVGIQGSSYFVTLSFTAMDQTIQDKIVQFVFDTERELIRKRRGQD